MVSLTSRRRSSSCWAWACALLVGCGPQLELPKCPEGTELRGDQCTPPVPLAPPDGRRLPGPPDAGPLLDAGPTLDAGPAPDAGPTPDAGPVVDAGPAVDAGSDVTLPFFVEDHYVMSGFFSETGAASAQRDECSGVQGTKPGATCMQLALTPNGDAFGGFFFQYPENNWGTSPGLAIPPGAKQIRFRAWGASGGERVKLGAGIDNGEVHADGFSVETTVTLTSAPTEYFVDLRDVSYARVAGGFSWVAETPTGAGSVTFFLDNIEWTAEEPVETAVSVPFWVDDHFAMSGFFPGPPGSVEVVEGCSGFTGTDPASVCRRITFTPNGLTFGGFFFQFPENNFGAQPGKAIAPGATQITFRAWGASGGELAGFGAGVDNDLPNDDGWHVETAPAPLAATPTEYTLDISGVSYDLVVGGFLWVLSTPDGSTPVTFYLDNVRWQ